ncbi:MAG: GNAT family N-acetyltransferase [Chloroflexi bacterium]|nr:GNAT family N-acetyltransferase [Chloroflexota bacterium]
MSENNFLRRVFPEDAGAFLALRKALDAETAFLMLEPGERQTSEEEMRATLERIVVAERDYLAVLECDGELVGYLSAQAGSFRRNRHSAYITTGIRQAYCGQGWGKRLFADLIGWAKVSGITRLELTVMSHNQRAIGLYTRMGFQKEGVKHHSLRVDNQFVDEDYMALLLD